MIWLKIAGAAVGVFIALAIVSSVVHFVIWAAFAALVVGAIALVIKAATRKKQVGEPKAERQVTAVAEVPERRLPSQPARPDVDDELARLKREMGS
jgi:membrane protein implicated in regulation of membrane protease activity